jgi:hypothetical protein
MANSSKARLRVQEPRFHFPVLNEPWRQPFYFPKISAIYDEYLGSEEEF